jgi:hypothetical protein
MRPAARITRACSSNTMMPFRAKCCVMPAGGDSQLRQIGLSVPLRRSSNMVATCGASAPNPELKNSPMSTFGASAMVFSTCGSVARLFGLVTAPGVRSIGLSDDPSAGKIGLTRSRCRRIERRHFQARAHALIGAEHAAATAERGDPRRACRAAIAGPQRGELQRHVEQLFGRVHADRGAFAEDRVEYAVGAGELAGVRERGLAAVLGGPRP